MKKKISKSKRIPDQKLNSYEQGIEDSLSETGPVPVATQERLQEVKDALVNAQIKRAWGGARKGSGRKPKAYSKQLLNLTLEAAAIIDREAERTGEKKSAIASRLITAGKK